MKQIKVTVDRTGAIKIAAAGFVGADCERATKALEQALGSVGERRKTSEYYQRQGAAATQKR